MAFKPLLAIVPGPTETRAYAEVHSYTCSLLMSFTARPVRPDCAVILYHNAHGKLTSWQVIMLFGTHSSDRDHVLIPKRFSSETKFIYMQKFCFQQTFVVKLFFLNNLLMFICLPYFDHFTSK